MKNIIFVAAIIIVSLGIGLSFLNSTRNVQTEPVPLSPTVSPQNPAKAEIVAYKIEEFAINLDVPWSIVFTSPNRILVTERPGKIREIINGTVNTTPLIAFSEVKSVQEEGLMGLEKDPDYNSNKYLYAAISYPKNNGYTVKIVRLKDNDSSISLDKTLIDDIPAATVHAGNRLKFGPDGKLYSTTGDSAIKERAQDKNSLAGKILRINSDGSIPTDNPTNNSLVFSTGHRNPQGIAWHPVTHELYETEHGPSVFDGPAGGDEVNRIIGGGNYGWPIVSHDKTREGLISPLHVYTPAVAPASAMIYSGAVFPQFQYNLFFGGLRGTGVYRIILDPEDPNKILSQEKISDINVGRIRDVVEGPDGYIYFSTSNTDGRGKPNKNDDKIYRLVPRSK